MLALNFFKKLIMPVLLFFLFHEVQGQTLRRFEILPTQPLVGDSIQIIFEFEYNGDCNFGLVQSDVIIQANDIFTNAQYCGYGLSTLCLRTDSIHIQPLAEGSYNIRFMIHQGSVCPFSGFDITLYALDTVLQVLKPNHSSALLSKNRTTLLYPNPATTSIQLKTNQVVNEIWLLDVLGNKLLCPYESQTNRVWLNSLSPGWYLLCIKYTDGYVSQEPLIIIKH